jgi:DNA mismatch repair protein MutS
VPHHALENYISRLIERGYHVAVCDQIGDVTGRGPVDRAVTRVLTPGTVIEPELLPEKQQNYLLALAPVGDPDSGAWQKAGLAYVDISTGEYAATQLEGQNTGVLVLEELARLNPREVIMPESWAARGVTLPEGIHLTPVADWRFDYDTAAQILRDHFRVKTLDGYGLAEMPYGVSAAGSILFYLRDTQRNSLAQLTSIRAYNTANFGSIHAAQFGIDRNDSRAQHTRQFAGCAGSHRHGDGRAPAADVDQSAAA